MLYLIWSAFSADEREPQAAEMIDNRVSQKNFIKELHRKASLTVSDPSEGRRVGRIHQCSQEHILAEN